MTELCKSQIIRDYNPDPNATTILHCDASDKSEWKGGMALTFLTLTEFKYSDIERECLAVVFYILPPREESNSRDWPFNNGTTFKEVPV